ncbi:MAG: 30S ribosomal protein S20 [Clostridia bacterium]
MPNIKSAIKRVGVNIKKNEENKCVRTKLSTYMKKFKSAIQENKIEDADKLFIEVVSLLDSAAAQNLVHKNFASRKQAYFAKILDTAKKN